MKRQIYDIARRLRMVRYATEEKGNALTETVILFPILTILLIGCYDLGQGIYMNQKTIASSQIIGDLIARNRSVDMDTVEDIIRAGELAFEPYPITTFGYDIISVQFDEDGDPVVLWRITENMPPNNAALASADGLVAEGDGLVIVSVRYIYDPFFTNFVVSEINMEEVAFFKGRRSATVTCADCPS